MDLCLDDKSNLSKEAESFDKFSDLDYGSDSDEELGNNDINENIKKDSSEIKAENIVIASAFLPFDLIKKENSNKWDVEIVDNPFYNSLYKLSENNQNITWVGCFRNQFDLKEEELDSLINSLKKRRILIVKVDKETFFQFCNIITDVFEPIFHYYSFFHDRKTIRNFDELWKAYKRFNEAFSKVISNYISDGTLVWVHDYHLLLTANFLISQKVLEEKNNKNYSIGLFIHAPFPGSDVFKRFPYRDEILKSMMCFDMIGFHTFDSSRSFFTSCKRLLQINYESTKEGALALSYFGRNVFLYVKHISCEIQLIKEELNKEDFQTLYSMLKEKYKGKFVFVGIDKINYLSGIRNKLEGYRRYLRDLGDKYNQNILVQYFYEEDDNIDFINDSRYKDIKAEIIQVSESIKKEFGEGIIEIVEKKLNISERLAIFASGNCYVSTYQREAFSLV
jgi:trehalose 6-phosphate synthase/phosphatase